MGLTWKVFKRKSTKIRHTIYKQSRKTSSQISREKNYVLHGIIYTNILSSMVDLHIFSLVSHTNVENKYTTSYLKVQNMKDLMEFRNK